MSDVTLEKEAFSIFQQAVLDTSDFPPVEFSLGKFDQALSELEAFLIPLNAARVESVWRASCVVGLGNRSNEEVRAIRASMIAGVKRADARLFYCVSRLHHFCSSAIVRYAEKRLVGSIVFGVRLASAPRVPTGRIEIGG